MRGKEEKSKETLPDDVNITCFKELRGLKI